MAINVTHSKVSTIPDGDDTSLIRPSDWNDDHVIAGLGTMAEQNANAVAITGGTISGVTIPASNITGTVTVPQGGTGATTLTGYVKGTGTTAMTASSTIPNTDITGLGTASTKDAGSANGVATLDAGGKVPVSELPAAVLGALSYQGTWNASTNTPTLTSSVGTKGYYYVVSVAGSTNLNGITDWVVGDWAVYNGTAWQKVDNTDAVTSVNGYTGTVVLGYADVGAFPATSTTGSGNVVLATGATQANPTISNYENFTPTTAPAYSEGRVWYDSTEKALAFYNDSSSIAVHVGQDLIVKVINNTGSTIANGAPVYITGTSSGQTYPNVALAKADVAATSAVIGLTNGAIANGAIGYVTSQGTIDNVNTSTFTVGQVLYLSPYSAGQLMNTIPPTGITVQVGVVTYVDSSAGHIYVKQTTPLAVPASIITGTLGVDHGGTGATTLTGYVKGSGTSAMTASATIPTTDLSGTVTNAQLANSAITINGTSTSLGGSISVGTVTSVTGTAPVVSSGGATPSISMAAANTTTNGYLTSTDWNTFNSKGAGTVTSVSISAPSIFTVSGSPVTGSGTLALTYSGTALPVANGGTGTTTSTGTAGSVVLSTNPTLAGLTDSGNLTFTGTGNRITGDFTNGTITSQVAFQTSTANSNTTVGAIPSGTGVLSGFRAFNNSDPTNAGYIDITASDTQARLRAGVSGTGTYLPMTFATNNSERLRIDTSGNVGIGTTAPGTPLAVVSNSSAIAYRVQARSADAIGLIQFTDNTASTQYGTIGTPAANTLAFSTVTTERMRIASSGGVSIGNTTDRGAGALSVASGIYAESTGPFMLNATTVSANFTIPANFNASSAGPITVNTGVTVTVSTGSTWVIV